MSPQAVDVQSDMNVDVEVSSVESLARRITRDLWDYTGGLPGRWVPLMILQERLALEDDTAAINAARLGVEQKWLEEFGDYNSVRLTDAGRCIE